MRDTPPDAEDERHLIEAVVTLARTLRDERDRLAERLREVENELNALTSRLDDRHIGGPDMAPQSPQRSARPGEAGARLETPMRPSLGPAQT